MENHNVVQVSGEIVTTFFAFLYNFNRNSEFCQSMGKIKAGLPSADYHYLLQFGIFPFFVDFEVKSRYFCFFSDKVYGIVTFYNGFSMRNYDFTVS